MKKRELCCEYVKDFQGKWVDFGNNDDMWYVKFHRVFPNAPGFKPGLKFVILGIRHGKIRVIKEGG